MGGWCKGSRGGLEGFEIALGLAGCELSCNGDDVTRKTMRNGGNSTAQRQTVMELKVAADYAATM